MKHQMLGKPTGLCNSQKCKKKIQELILPITMCIIYNGFRGFQTLSPASNSVHIDSDEVRNPYGSYTKRCVPFKNIE